MDFTIHSGAFGSLDSEVGVSDSVVVEGDYRF